MTRQLPPGGGSDGNDHEGSGTVRQHGLIYRVRWAHGEENVLRTFSEEEGARVLSSDSCSGFWSSVLHTHSKDATVSIWITASQR